MKRFLRKIARLLLILVLLNGLLYLVAEKLYFSEYREHALDYTSYLLADSHGVAISDFSSNYGIFNFSSASDSYLDMKRKLKFLIANTAVDTIYITVDDHTLSPYREATNNAERSEFYKAAADYSSYSEYITTRYIKHYLIISQPKIGKILLSYLKSSIKNGGLDTDDKNWENVDKAEKLKSVAMRIKDQFSDDTPSKILEKDLLDIVEICKEDEITLIGIKFPISADYINALHDRSYGADGLFRELDLTVLDFKHAYRQKDHYFKDQDHLNADGAATFVQQLVDQVHQQNNMDDK